MRPACEGRKHPEKNGSCIRIDVVTCKHSAIERWSVISSFCKFSLSSLKTTSYNVHSSRKNVCKRLKVASSIESKDRTIFKSSTYFGSKWNEPTLNKRALKLKGCISTVWCTKESFYWNVNLSHIDRSEQLNETHYVRRIIFVTSSLSHSMQPMAV